MNDIFAEVAPFYIYTGILDSECFPLESVYLHSDDFGEDAAVVLGIYYGYHSSEIIYYCAYYL